MIDQQKGRILYKAKRLLKNPKFTLLRHNAHNIANNLKWTHLRNIGQAKIFQITVIFPLIGYYILFSDKIGEVLRIKITEHNAVWYEHISTEARLYFLYFGLLSLSISSLIYSIFCPKVIKKYGDEADFVSSESDKTSVFEQSKICIEAIDYIQRPYFGKHPVHLDKRRFNEMCNFIRQVSQGGSKFSDNAHMSINVMHIYYKAKNDALTSIKCLCLIFMVIGFSLIFTPSIDVLVAVIEKIMMKI